MSDATSRNSPELDDPSIWRKLLFWVLVIIGVFIAFLYVKAQKDLTDHLRSKQAALEGIYNNIARARRSKRRLLWRKKVTELVTRCVAVFGLLGLNAVYLRQYSDGHTLPELLGYMTDFNAILLFAISICVFIRFKGSFDLRKTFDRFQNSILHMLYSKSEEAIEALLSTNLANREAIRQEIEETKKALRENEELIQFTKDTNTE